jgi:hypothetical protein
VKAQVVFELSILSAEGDDRSVSTILRQFPAMFSEQAARYGRAA